LGLKLGTWLASALLIVAAASPSALAQNGNRQPGGNNGGGNGGGGNRGGQGGGGFGGGFGGMGGFGRDMTEPAFTSRQLTKYGEMLNLTADQKAAIDTLFEGYSEETRAAAEKMRTKMDDVRSEFRDTQDPSVFTKMQDSMKTFRDARKKMDDGFTNDVKALLTPKQLEVWPTVEQTQRRETGLRRGFISGERVDLVSLVDDLKPSADVKASLKPILDQYAADLDRELVSRNAFQEKNMDKIGELMRSGDTDAAQKLIQEGREQSVKVRDVNRSFAKQIAAALPDDQRAQFNDAFKKASFPDVYRPTQATTALKAAAAFADLTPDQKDSIARLTDTHDHSLATVNEKLATAQEDSEMKFNIADMRNRFQRGGQGGNQDDPQANLRRDKRDLDRTTMDSLKKILTDDQIAKLPKPDQGNGRGGNGGGGQGANGRRQRGNGGQNGGGGGPET
jgi:hypothetical protein